MANVSAGLKHPIEQVGDNGASTEYRQLKRQRCTEGGEAFIFRREIQEELSNAAVSQWSKRSWGAVSGVLTTSRGCLPNIHEIICVLVP